ncbi:unnamed protein product [Closterium sp. NIES-54]
MPLTRTLTLNLKVPEPWLVEPAVADHDLDNLVLEKVADPSVVAVFELEALMITGGCLPAHGCCWVLVGWLWVGCVDTLSAR